MQRPTSQNIAVKRRRPDCLLRSIRSRKPRMRIIRFTWLATTSPGFFQPVEEGRAVVVACSLDLIKEAKLGAEKAIFESVGKNRLLSQNLEKWPTGGKIYS